MSASVRTAHGTVASRWERRDDGLLLIVSIPANTTAQVFVPASSPDEVTEAQRPAAESEGIRFLHLTADRAVFAVASGTYHLHTASVPGNIGPK